MITNPILDALQELDYLAWNYLHSLSWSLTGKRARAMLLLRHLLQVATHDNLTAEQKAAIETWQNSQAKHGIDEELAASGKIKNLPLGG